MIFVAVGTRKFQLNRLLSEIDTLVEKGLIKDKVFAQTGYSDYMPKNYDYIDFMPKPEFDNYIHNCDLLITHGGVGIILTALKNEKPTIVFPRLSKYGEHVDDHQLEITEAFVELNYVLQCLDKADLYNIISQSETHIFNKYISQRKNVVLVIKEFVDKL